MRKVPDALALTVRSKDVPAGLRRLCFVRIEAGQIREIQFASFFASLQLILRLLTK
jgi:hypothetical protein